MKGRNQRDRYRGKDNFDNNKSVKPRKTTGCKAGVGAKSGNKWVSGWNLQERRGMLSFIAGPYSGTSIHQGRDHEWENWVAKLKINGIPQQGVMPCLYDCTTGKLIFNDLDGGMVANPKTDYFGTYRKD